jgi:undecaprenyl-diphosphatase
MKKNLFRYRHLIFIVLLTIASLHFDQSVTTRVLSLRNVPLDTFMVVITQLEVVWVLFVILSVPILSSKKERPKIFLLWGSAALALFSAHILKMIFLAERPDILSLTEETSPRFPSMHAAVVFSAIPVLQYSIKKILPPWLIVAFLIAFSRIYVGVHFLSDILGGIAVGLFCGELFVWLDEKKNLAKRILKIHFELRRQVAHVVIGLGTIVGIQANIISVRDIAIIFALGSVLVITYKRKPDKIPVITPILSFFERKEDRMNFPGKGSFFLVAGILASLILFPQRLAITAIAILAVGDSVTNIIGRYFGEIENPLNPKKTIEGSLVGFFCSLAAASFFVSFWPAFFASAGAMFIESLPIKIGRYEVDDNLIIPLVSGYILSLWYL